ncbi:hypothetical protein JDFnp4_95 [Fusobacterium phage JD-Fnp4]|jgi:hypothetical protein|nr:hypothetical protein JDFnp4_95 [Fusobacterium phage JD-Fnp4]DAT92040.1 MAG TPA: hypothetical protein [Caudoviricetes sp.]
MKAPHLDLEDKIFSVFIIFVLVILYSIAHAIMGGRI